MHVKVRTLWSPFVIIEHRIVVNFNIIWSCPLWYKSEVLSSIVNPILTLFKVVRMSIGSWPACFCYNNLPIAIFLFQLPVLVNKAFTTLLRSYCIFPSLGLALPVRVGPFPGWVNICSNKSASICQDIGSSRQPESCSLSRADFDIRFRTTNLIDVFYCHINCCIALFVSNKNTSKVCAVVIWSNIFINILHCPFTWVTMALKQKNTK